MTPTLSILDLALVPEGGSPADALAATVEVARAAEASGHVRCWYAEHHNMSAIVSSATSLVIAHVAQHTETIRLGSGGIMLPNHSPLTIAEQFGTLATLYGDRIDLGLGRAPGSDRAAHLAMKRLPDASERFVDDVDELRRYLAPDGSVNGVIATPGQGTEVPLYILGSSLFGARVAAHLGLPYAFASQFAPSALSDAVMTYRSEFQASEICPRPHVIAGVNVLAAETTEIAEAQLVRVQRSRLRRFLGLGPEVSDDDVDRIKDTPQGRQVLSMMTYTAVGDRTAVGEYLRAFAEHADADELICMHAAPSTEERVASVHLAAEALTAAPIAS